MQNVRCSKLAVGWFCGGGLLACQLAFDTSVLTSEREPVEEPRPDASLVDASPISPDASDTGAPRPAPFFVDDFQRDPSPSLGNGWIEKTDDAWELVDRRALKLGSGRNYRDNVVYRPEAMERDVEVAVEIFTVDVPTRSASVHLRIQKESVGVPQTLDSYCLYTQNDEVAVIGRQGGTVAAATRATFRFDGGRLKQGRTYRMRLRARDVEGGVSLEGSLEEKLAPDQFREIGRVATIDTQPDRITTPGHVGFSGDLNADRSFAVTRFEATRVQ